MKSITINGSQRESVGKTSTKALRNAGQVPCVLYGGEAKPVHFTAPELAFSKLVYTPNAHTVVIKLDNGDSYNAVMQDIQFHPVTDRILHIDFYEIYENKTINGRCIKRSIKWRKLKNALQKIKSKSHSFKITRFY